jgi:hypothetical protein
MCGARSRPRSCVPRRNSLLHLGHFVTVGGTHEAQCVHLAIPGSNGVAQKMHIAAPPATPRPQLPHSKSTGRFGVPKIPRRWMGAGKGVTNSPRSASRDYRFSHFRSAVIGFSSCQPSSLGMAAAVTPTLCSAARVRYA